MRRSWTARRWRPAPSARCGACAIPVLAARAVLDSGHAVLLAGAAADDFAASQGLAMVEPGYFTTQRRVEALRVLKARRGSRALRCIVGSRETWHRRRGRARPPRASGRRNVDGRLQQQAFRAASATARSSARAPTRRDGVCAVSCTGQGEIFMRRVAAYDLAARMMLRRASARGRRECAGLRHAGEPRHRRGSGCVGRDGQSGCAVQYAGDVLAAGSPPTANSRSRPIASCMRMGPGLTVSGAPILIWGAGAIGGVLGAYWARAGVPVLMVDIVPEHVEACRTSRAEASAARSSNSASSCRRRCRTKSAASTPSSCWR